MFAVQRYCTRGAMLYCKTTDEGRPDDLIFAVDRQGYWLSMADGSAADEPGFDWAQRENPLVGYLVGDLIGSEQAFDGRLEAVGDGWRLWTLEGKVLLLLPQMRMPAETEPEPEARPDPEVVILPSGKKRSMRFYRGEDPLLDGDLRVLWVGYRVEMHPDGSVTLFGETYEVFSGEDARALAAYTERIGVRVTERDGKAEVGGTTGGA